MKPKKSKDFSWWEDPTSKRIKCYYRTCTVYNLNTKPCCYPTWNCPQLLYFSKLFSFLAISTRLQHEHGHPYTFCLLQIHLTPLQDESWHLSAVPRPSLQPSVAYSKSYLPACNTRGVAWFPGQEGISGIFGAKEQRGDSSSELNPICSSN